MRYQCYFFSFLLAQLLEADLSLEFALLRLAGFWSCLFLFYFFLVFRFFSFVSCFCILHCTGFALVWLSCFKMVNSIR